MAMSVALPKLTYEDYLAIPPDGKRHELIDGEHYVSAAPNLRHQTIVGNLHFYLAQVVRRSQMGWLWLSPVDVKLSELDVVQPDLVFVAHEHADQRAGTHIAGAPDLAIEVLSEGSRRHDEVVKRQLYDRAGVAEYWIVDPELETVKVYRRGEGGGFERLVELSVERGERLETPLLPGLSLPLGDLFAGS